MSAAHRGAADALLAAAVLAPAGLVGWMSFTHGGNPSGVAGAGAVVLAVLLAARLAVAPRTVCRPSAPGVVALVGLAALAGWTLLSMLWSGAEAGAVRDFCRAVLYLLLVAGTATLPREALRWVVRSLAAVLAGIGVLALLSRTWPELVWTPITASSRLLYPIGYWNALAFMLATGAVLLAHLSSDRQERAGVRIAAAALMPALACALYLTQSRGAMAAALAGSLLYAGLTRSRGVGGTVVATVPPAAAALAVAYVSVDLVTAAWRWSDGVRQGHRLLLAVCVAGLAAAVLRRVLLARDDALPVALPRPSRRIVAGLGGAVALLVMLGALAAGVPAAVEREFLGGGPETAWTDPRTRLTSSYSNGRADLWRVAANDFRAQPVTGAGAGGFAAAWARERPDESEAVDAHSLYVEVLGELGVVGLLLLGAFLGALGTAVATSRSPRALRAAVLALGAMWALDAAVEWLWEIPAATIAVLALAGAAAGTGERLKRSRRTLAARSAAAALVVAVAAVPAAEAAARWRLDAAGRAYNAGDCAAARTSASSAGRVAPWQAAPKALLGLCAARGGDAGAAQAALAAAVARDPGDWQLELARAIVTGATGGDPSASIRRAAALNPRSTEVRFLYALSLQAGAADRLRAAFPTIDRLVYMPIGPGELCSGDGSGYWRWTTWTTARCRPSLGVPRWSTPTVRPGPSP